MAMIKSNNEMYGFHGTMKNSRRAAKREFNAVAQALIERFDMNGSEDIVVRFLDSTYGRHFADKVVESGKPASSFINDPYLNSCFLVFFKKYNPADY